MNAEQLLQIGWAGKYGRACTYITRNVGAVEKVSLWYEMECCEQKKLTSNYQKQGKQLF